LGGAHEERDRVGFPHQDRYDGADSADGAPAQRAGRSDRRAREEGDPHADRAAGDERIEEAEARGKRSDRRNETRGRLTAHSARSAFSKAASVCAISASPWASDTNAASNWDGGRYTPSSR